MTGARNHSPISRCHERRQKIVVGRRLTKANRMSNEIASELHLLNIRVLLRWWSIVRLIRVVARRSAAASAEIAHIDAVDHLLHFAKLLNVHIVAAAKAHPPSFELLQNSSTLRVSFIRKVAAHLRHHPCPLLGVHAIRRLHVRVVRIATPWASRVPPCATCTSFRLLLLWVQLFPPSHSVFLVRQLAKLVQVLGPLKINFKFCHNLFKLARRLHADSFLHSGLIFLRSSIDHGRQEAAAYKDTTGIHCLSRQLRCGLSSPASPPPPAD
mmetsp:Transcript_62411/g.103816  ORF Transcript_62411/g.103816 Transcript_62411/m.103816 type:complete len:269 (-) Transcript_62411:12-818(-)